MAGLSDDAPFDFIVVGAGASGSAIASRIAAPEHSNGYKILLLEAGRDNRPPHECCNGIQEPHGALGRSSMDLVMCSCCAYVGSEGATLPCRQMCWWRVFCERNGVDLRASRGF